jgi:hypothetical protein
MPRTVPQLAGMIVTAIVVFGTDTDILTAMPLGIVAGALTTFLIALADGRERLAPLQSRRAKS